MIRDEIIDEVLDRADIVELIGRTVNLKKAGTVFKGLCPFHNEKTPSFTVSPQRRSYHCFGCGAHGHAIRFLMDHDRLSFPEAIKQLAATCGVEVPDERPESPEHKAERVRKKTEEERLLAVQEQVTAYYTQALFGPAARGVRDYLTGRGITPKAAEAFRLGFADGQVAPFARFAQDRALALADLEALGLVVFGDQPHRPGQPLEGGYLRFRDRLMFPVIDLDGDVVGFTGRLLTDEKKAAKYLNSPETPVFTKGHHLYGAHTARHAARKAGRLIFCEGNVDTIALWQAGFEGTVAAMGTALTPRQARLAKRLADQLVCVMDGDAAGLKAVFSSLVPFLEVGFQPRAVLLPNGEDPDSFIRKEGPEAFGRLLDEARPLLDLLIDRVQREHPADPPGRVAALRALVPSLLALPDDLTRSVYQSRVAAALGLESALVAQALTGEKPKRLDARVEAPKPRVSEAPERSQAPSSPPPVVESWGLGFGDGSAVQRPSPLEGPNRPQIEEIRVPRFERELFEFIVQFPDMVLRLRDLGGDNRLTHPALAAFVAGLIDEVCAGRAPNVDRLVSEQPPAVAAFLWRCRARPPAQDEGTIRAAFDDAVKQLRQHHLMRRRDELWAHLRSAWNDPALRATLHGELEAVIKQQRDLNELKTEGTH